METDPGARMALLGSRTRLQTRAPAPQSRLSLLPITLNPRFRSLPRANVLVLGSLLAALLLSHFPHIQANPLLTLPALLSVIGTADTIRCIRPRWSFYHAGVIFCIYMDLMAVTLVLFLLLYPYFA